MPWFEYVCEKCGERLRRNVAVAHRRVEPKHGTATCYDGRLRRVVPVAGPSDRSRASAGRRLDRSGPAGAASDGPGAGATPDVASQECVLEAARAIMGGAAPAARWLELVRPLLATLPTLSGKLRLIEGVARGGGADQLADVLAEEIARAPDEILAREPRLLDLLLLARRRDRLGRRELEHRLDDDRVMVRLLRSALRWIAPDAAADADAAAEPARMAWSELHELVGEAVLRRRIDELVARPLASGDRWDRLAAELAAEGAFRQE